MPKSNLHQTHLKAPARRSFFSTSSFYIPVDDEENNKIKFENHEMLICSNVRKTRRKRKQIFSFSLFIKNAFSRVIQTIFYVRFSGPTRKHGRKKKNVESENNMMRFFRCVIIHRNTMDGQSQMIYNCS